VSFLYTAVPYNWRRALSIIRALLAAAALLLVLTQPVGNRAAMVAAVSIYVGWSLYLMLKDPADTNIYPAGHLVFDTAFFILASFLPGAFGTWFTLAVWINVLAVATLLYTWRHVAVVVSMGLPVLLLAGDSRFMASFGPALAAGGGIAILLSIHRQQLQERLSAALKRSVISRSEAEMAREQERQRIAADFHDGPLQSFISFQVRLEIIRKLMSRDTEAAMSELVQLQELGRSQVTELRAFVRGMQPAQVTPANVSLAIREAVEHFERDSGVAAQLFCGKLEDLDEVVAVEVLQIVREALNNVRKHSRASRVSIVIEPVDKEVEIAVEDDGSGFPFSGTYTLDELEILRLGPKSIQRRVRTLGGDLTLDSRPTAGATLKIRIPAIR
jgi:signal transduction histidine kinase